ncbi:hypothetical protein [Pseudomonas sp. HAR-UPW-AIA-41]|uniref:hypothetical protein n=1 Tax=Pseudomonas sp. HAR-UPW-AIA-41 TaxID=1985301 RepID=UPI001141D3F7|nr:hypothetical protein [Pseudomonas sp. HAR-UPW-AIA-41]
MKNYLGFGFLRRATSCIHAVVRCLAVLKTGSKCSFTIRKLGSGFLLRSTAYIHVGVRFFACFDQPTVVTALRLALAASPTFFNSLLSPPASLVLRMPRS